MKKAQNNVGKVIAIGASVAAVAAAGYFLFGPDAKKNQKKMKGWMIKMKGEVVEKMEKAKEMSEPMYHQIIDSVSEKYAKASGATKEEVADMAKSLKKHWKMISGTKTKAKKMVKKVKKTK